MNAICIDYLNHVIYVAGSTTGFMDPALKRSARFNRFSAFLMKLDADSLDTIWAKQVFTQPSQVHAPQDVLGMGCTVDPKDGDNGVYLTGIVHDHGNIEKEGLGNGLDDIFVTKFNSNGNEIWRKQIGTDKNDVVAKGHKSITFDDEGNMTYWIQKKILQALHSISGVNDMLEIELEKVYINDVIKNDDNAKK